MGRRVASHRSPTSPLPPSGGSCRAARIHPTASESLRPALASRVKGLPRHDASSASDGRGHHISGRLHEVHRARATGGPSESRETRPGPTVKVPAAARPATLAQRGTSREARRCRRALLPARVRQSWGHRVIPAHSISPRRQPRAPASACGRQQQRHAPPSRGVAGGGWSRRGNSPRGPPALTRCPPPAGWATVLARRREAAGGRITGSRCAATWGLGPAPPASARSLATLAQRACLAARLAIGWRVATRNSALPRADPGPRQRPQPGHEGSEACLSCSRNQPCPLRSRPCSAATGSTAPPTRVADASKAKRGVSPSDPRAESSAGSTLLRAQSRLNPRQRPSGRACLTRGPSARGFGPPKAAARGSERRGRAAR